ncbi:MAG: alpha/beta fold hydrolase [Candidatus Zixiibacteriota bacterium]
MPDIRIHYDQTGSQFAQDRVPLVFVHAFTLDRRLWAGQLEFFGRQRWVLAPDSRGHGLSDAPATCYSRDHRAQDLLQFADILMIERMHLVGLSMGGSTAVGFALKHPDRLASLSLVSSAVAGFGSSKKVSVIDKLAKEKGIEAARSKWLQWSLTRYKKEHSEIAKLVRTMIMEHSGATWMDKMRGQYARNYDLQHVHTISSPTAIFVGTLDKLFVPLAHELHEKIPGSRLIEYPQTGHLLNLERPDQFNRDLKLFVDEVEAR